MLGFPLCVEYSVGLDKGINACIHHFSIIQNIFTTLKILCDPPVHSVPIPHPWKLLIFLVSSAFCLFQNGI